MRTRGWLIGPAFGLAFLSCAIGPAVSGDTKPSYPAMAPLAQYQTASPADEIALARSAAPASIVGNAEFMTFGKSGYETAVKGTNGFVCLVERSWGANFNDPQFWNPRVRAPICFNSIAARTALPEYLERTKWVLAGVSTSDMTARIRAAIAAGTFVEPEAGAMSYMMSKQGYLSDADGHWHPHLMFFVARTNAAAWGANLAGSPVIAAEGNPEPITTFLVPVTKWSDGTPAVMEMQ